MSTQPTDQPDTDGTAAKAASIVDTILNLDEFLSGDVRRARKSARICTKPWLEADLDRLADELDSLTDDQGNALTDPGDDSMGGGRTATVVAREHREVQLEYAAAMRTIVVEAMPENEWRTWFRANEKALDQDDTPPEVYNDLISKCAVQPPITVEKAAAMRERLGHAQVTEIASKAWAVNTASGVDVPKSPLSSHVLRQQERARS